MTAPEQDSAGEAPVKEGDVLASKYRVEKVLGIGGMGVVVAAHHVDLDERVALKFLLPQAAQNTELVERFIREARASVRLKGSHVAKVRDVGRLDSGAPYIVMEYLEGSDLTGLLKRSGGTKVSISDAVGYILHAAEGLAEAHALGIIHRDLKPGNLFLTRGVDGKPLVKVLDFGISKTIDRSITGEAASLTKTEMLLGSPLYMSPEQMRSSKHVDERADIWALGAILYEMLTGTVPFIADTIMGLCFAVAQEEPKNPQEARPEIPNALRDAILKCLAKDPAQRFGNVAELAAAIEPFGPARDRGTAERALDVLGTGKRKPIRSIGPDVPADPTSDPTLSASAQIALGLASSDVTPAPQARSNPTPGAIPSPAIALGSQSDPSMQKTPAPGVSQGDVAAVAAWGGTRSEPKPKMPEPARRGWLIPVAVGAVIIGAIGGVAVFKSNGTPKTGTPIASATATTGSTTSSAAAAAGPATTTKLEPIASATTSAAPSASENVQTAPSATTAPATIPKPGLRPVVGTVKSSKPVTTTATATATATAAPTGSGFIRVRE